MRRLYLQIYLTIVAILVIAVVSVGGLARFAFDSARLDDMMSAAGELAVNALPPADAPRDRQQDAIGRLHETLRIDLALYSATGTLVAAAGRRLPPLDFDGPAGRMRGHRATWLVPMSDGRFLVTSIPRGPWRPGPWLLAALAAIAIAVAIGAYPLVRRLTRRLERLKQGVDRLGTGDLSARVGIEGKDEVAALAQSFNRSASQIEELVRSKRMLLANASHELRTPLTRINMAIALAGDQMSPDQREHVLADIAELDQLIEEILIASRLDAMHGPERSEEIDLLALAAEEAARDGIGVEGASVFVRGERALLRRMIRNLIDNARRHAGDVAPEVRVNRTADRRGAIEVRDHGAGIPAAERDRIFEPFYRLPGTAETGKGSGLGLALVRQIARHHAGEVTCEAAPGSGSRFTVVLPSIEPEKATPA
jgi:signal transduction histidine kinase